MRKKVFGKGRISGVKSKDFVKMMLESKYPYKKDIRKTTKTGNFDIKNEDMYDACVCALSIDKLEK